MHFTAFILTIHGFRRLATRFIQQMVGMQERYRQYQSRNQQALSRVAQSPVATEDAGSSYYPLSDVYVPLPYQQHMRLLSILRTVRTAG